MKSERIFDGQRVPLCNHCLYFVKGSSRCRRSELLDETKTGYWPSDALGNRIDNSRCGMEGKYFHQRKLTHPLMSVNVEQYVFIGLILFCLCLILGGI